MQDMAQEKVVVSLTSPTPMWVRKIVRFLTWITAIYAFLSIQVNLTDFGVSIAMENLILKYMAVFTGLVSVIARFLGVEPIRFDTDKPMSKG
jgi:hypothetical protein